MMYKKASHNTQERIERQAIGGHLNEHGIDPTALKNADERLRDQLVLDKKKREGEIADLKRKMNDASAINKGYRTGAHTPAVVYRSWQRQADIARREILQIESKLAEYKERTRQ